MKAFTLVMYVFLTLLFGMIVFNNYQALVPIEIGKSYYDKSPLLESKLKPGDPIRWKVKYDHYTDGVYVDVTREMRCGQDLYSFTPVSFVTMKGLVEFVNNTLELPLRTSKGSVCFIETVGHYHISPQRTIDVVSRTEDFTVI